VDHGPEEPRIKVADVRGVRQEGKGLGEERIPRQNGHGWAEDPMAGGATAPQIIVIHRRQVVVD